MNLFGLVVMVRGGTLGRYSLYQGHEYLILFHTSNAYGTIFVYQSTFPEVASNAHPIHLYHTTKNEAGPRPCLGHYGYSFEGWCATPSMFFSSEILESTALPIT